MNLVLKNAREQVQLSQLEMARKMCISERAYQNYEANKREPKVRLAIRIAEVLNSTVEELFKQV